MNAYITGSHAYGTPRPDSDIDVAVLMSQKDLEMLFELSGAEMGDSAVEHGGGSLRFGKLNLLIMVNEDQFKAWKEGTEELIARKPVTRDEAVRTLEAKEREIFEPTIDHAGISEF